MQQVESALSLKQIGDRLVDGLVVGLVVNGQSVWCYFPSAVAQVSKFDWRLNTVNIDYQTVNNIYTVFTKEK